MSEREGEREGGRKEKKPKEGMKIKTVEKERAEGVRERK